jgi:large subunit ribosomal protein L23
MDIYQIIKRPLVTEKGMHQTKLSHGATRTRPARGGSYTFEVHPEANKQEIRTAVEKIYNVRVARVRTSNHPGKRRRYKFKMGLTRHWKKAVVVLEANSHIDLF